VKTLNLIILALFLTGCSAFEQKIGAYKQDPFCCIPDTEFPHSCDGHILCDIPINLITKETEL
jgi:hypothetical protein